ncbi:hypothetical protein J6590_018745 [Homalodisca vitripennis]|nr:hypothetical protein J6590_018745 [Homalodisca vitripennis]
MTVLLNATFILTSHWLSYTAITAGLTFDEVTTNKSAHRMDRHHDNRDNSPGIQLIRQRTAAPPRIGLMLFEGDRQSHDPPPGITSSTSPRQWDRPSKLPRPCHQLLRPSTARPVKFTKVMKSAFLKARTPSLTLLSRPLSNSKIRYWGNYQWPTAPVDIFTISGRMRSSTSHTSGRPTAII